MHRPCEHLVVQRFNAAPAVARHAAIMRERPSSYAFFAAAAAASPLPAQSHPFTFRAERGLRFFTPRHMLDGPDLAVHRILSPGPIGRVGPNWQCSSRRVSERCDAELPAICCSTRARENAHRAGVACVATIKLEPTVWSRRRQDVSMTGGNCDARRRLERTALRLEVMIHRADCDHNPHSVSDLPMSTNRVDSLPSPPTRSLEWHVDDRAGFARAEERRVMRSNRGSALKPRLRLEPNLRRNAQAG